MSMHHSPAPLPAHTRNWPLNRPALSTVRAVQRPDHKPLPGPMYITIGGHGGPLLGYTWRIWSGGTSFYMKSKVPGMKYLKLSIHGDPRHPRGGGFEIAMDPEEVSQQDLAAGAIIGQRHSKWPIWFRQPRRVGHACRETALDTRGHVPTWSRTRSRRVATGRQRCRGETSTEAGGRRRRRPGRQRDSAAPAVGNGGAPRERVSRPAVQRSGRPVAHRDRGKALRTP